MEWNDSFTAGGSHQIKSRSCHIGMGGWVVSSGLWILCEGNARFYHMFKCPDDKNCICSSELYVNQAMRLIFCLNEKNQKSVTSLNCSISRLFHNSRVMVHNAQPTTYVSWPIHLRDLASTLKLVNASFYWQDFRHNSWNIPHVLEVLACEQAHLFG